MTRFSEMKEEYSHFIHSLTLRKKISFYLMLGVILTLIATVYIWVPSQLALASSKGLKLYLTVDTNLRSQDIRIDTFQHGNKIYGHNGFMNPGSNEYTLNYPRHLVDNGQFEICIFTWNDGSYCGNGFNSEEKKPESVFISASEGRNMGNIQGDNQGQNQPQNQDNIQNTAQNQNNEQKVIIYNCPADSKCVIEQ